MPSTLTKHVVQQHDTNSKTSGTSCNHVWNCREKSLRGSLLLRLHKFQTLCLVSNGIRESLRQIGKPTKRHPCGRAALHSSNMWYSNLSRVLKTSVSQHFKPTRTSPPTSTNRHSQTTLAQYPPVIGWWPSSVMKASPRRTCTPK